MPNSRPHADPAIGRTQQIRRSRILVKLLYTLGHGQLQGDTFRTTLRAAGVGVAADVRRFPGSRKHPQFGADALRESLGTAKIAYRPFLELGGRRVPVPDSRNTGLRNSGFRGYADYMASLDFRMAFNALMVLARERPTAIFCAETLWWMCHRRLVADAAVLLGGIEVIHLTPSTRASHVLTPGIRREGDTLIYEDAGTTAM
jgi:uncharacterized protein (DUF488 family)